MSENGEPQTPKEIAEHRVAMAVRDGWLAIGELCRLRNDPICAPFVAEHESDLWSIQTQVSLLLSDIETSRAPKLRIVQNGQA